MMIPDRRRRRQVEAELRFWRTATVVVLGTAFVLWMFNRAICGAVLVVFGIACLSIAADRRARVEEWRFNGR